VAHILQNPGAVQYRWNLVPPAQQAAMLYSIAAAALVFNLLDAVLTMVWVSSGLAVEANPLLEPVLAASPVGFVVIKCALVSLGLLLLWRLRQRATAAAAMVGTAVVYFAVVMYHLRGLMS
jgi:hypothetical protein